ncbi:hypothetical protein B0E54_03416 [Micromonospora sp. MH99]|nr:hypothetical protein [Micromonospora sp. MH99]
MNGTRRLVPACSPRQARSAAAEVKASTWVRPPVVQVPQPADDWPDGAGVETGNSRSVRDRRRK